MSWLAAVIAAVLAGLAGCVQAPPVPATPEPTPAEQAARRQAEAAAVEQAALEARVAEAVQRADEAYVYGYPLLVGEMLRQRMSGAAKPAGHRVPANSFWHARRLPAAGEPRHPLVDDADTLASFAWLDLDREAMLVAWPAMKRRWYSVALHSQWMQALHMAGSGVGDGKAARVLVAGPDWQGSVPPGATLLRSPTRHVLLALRIQTSGSAADLRAVQVLQAQLRIVPQTVRTRRTPAEAAAAPALPAASGERTPQQQVAALDTAAAFELLAHLMGRAAPPAAADEPLLARIAAIGIEPGKPFRLDALEPAVQAALADTGARVQRRLTALRPQLFARAGNWQAPPAGGDFGTDYVAPRRCRRAAMAGGRPAAAAGDEHAQRCRGPAAGRRARLPAALRARRAAAGGRLLVADTDGRHRPGRPAQFRRRQCRAHQPGHARPAAGRRRRRAGVVRTEPVAGPGQRRTLAAGAEGRIRADAAPVRAEDRAAVGLAAGAGHLGAAGATPAALIRIRGRGVEAVLTSRCRTSTPARRA